MMFPIIFAFVVMQPVPTLNLGARHYSREYRRRNRYGKQDFWSKYRGEMSPKQMRESGL